MKNKVSQINKSIEKWETDQKRSRSLSEAVSRSTIAFKHVNQGIEVLAFAAAIRALGLSNRDLQPRKLSNYIRSGYLQIQIICSIILFQFRGDHGVSRDDLYDAVCEVFPLTTYANFRKVLRTGVDNEIFIRSRAETDSRRTLYSLSDEMLEPICTYFLSILSDFGVLYSQVIEDGLSNNDIYKLLSRITKNTGLKTDKPK